jgi:AcrR family transcriptional regulator
MTRATRDRTAVLEAAARVIAERGVDATRFRDVSAASGVPVSSLQYSFGSREDMLLAALRHASRTEIDGLTADLAVRDGPWDRLTRIVAVALAGFGGVPAGPGRRWLESWGLALHDRALRSDVLADTATWRLLVADAVRAGREQGDFAADVDPERVAVQAVALCDGVGMPIALGDPAVPPSAALDLVLDALAAVLGYHPR